MMEGADWQMGKDRKECMTYMFDNEVFCDVEFKVGEEGELIKAHKLLLASRSPVFEGMLFGKLQETKSPMMIPDVDPAVFKALLR